MIKDFDTTSAKTYISLLEKAEKQSLELNDSIKYASYIQAALLPSKAQMSRLLPSHFVFFRPRDIVSGDFYWINKQKDYVILAVADCTGHGVPGGFLSMLGISFLNEIVGKDSCHSASSILNHLRERVMKTLHQTGERYEQKDGMDIGLCLVDFENNRLQFAGANNPVYIIRQGNLIEIKGDRMPIGINIVVEKSFTNHFFDLQENDMIYLITDGYADQFGGLKERKLKYKPFRDILLRIYNQSMEDQYHALDKELKDWMGNLSQIDDILIVGFKYIRDKSI